MFTVITSNSRVERGSDVSVKRRKMGTSDGESDSDGEGRVGRKRAADVRESTVISEPVAAPVARRPVDLIVLGVNYKTTDEGFKNTLKRSVQSRLLRSKGRQRARRRDSVLCR